MFLTHYSTGVFHQKTKGVQEKDEDLSFLSVVYGRHNSIMSFSAEAWGGRQLE